MNLGAPLAGNLTRLKEELDDLSQLGIKNLRIMGSTQGPNDKEKRIVPALEYDKGKYDEDIFEGLDIFLYEMGKRDMKAVVTLNNFWEWSGGFPQYFEWYRGNYNLYPAQFYEDELLKEKLDDFIKIIVNRENTAYKKRDGKTILYKDDPTIMSWQLANEPRAGPCGAWVDWINKTSTLIKTLAPRQLVSIGNEGTITGCSEEGNYVENVDYITFHAWAQNWGWYSPSSRNGLSSGISKAHKYISENVNLNKDRNKPMVLEEFGLARNRNSYDPNSYCDIRDDYYSGVFSKVYSYAKDHSLMSGVNFWAYGGQGRPRENGGWWKADDDLIGDPPHERQGWYSVYNTDFTTLEMLRDWVDKFDSLCT